MKDRKSPGSNSIHVCLSSSNCARQKWNAVDLMQLTFKSPHYG